MSVAKKKKAGLYAASLKGAVREVLRHMPQHGCYRRWQTGKGRRGLIKSGAYDAQLKED